MGRWPGGTREKVQRAALELFADRGYGATTVDDIAARAGVSARTVFRHFRDKEEVLFGADDELGAVLRDAARSAPPDLSPLAVVHHALDALAVALGPDRAALRRRAAVLASDVALQGRDLTKQARWTTLLAGELVARGAPRGTADLLAATGAAAFRTTWTAWLADDGDGGLQERLDTARAAQERAWTGPWRGGGGSRPGPRS